MALRQSKQILAGFPVLSPLNASCGVLLAHEYVVQTGLALNDVIEMGGIPEGCIVASARAVMEDLDSNVTPLIALDMGLISGEYGKKDNTRTCGTEFLSADVTGRTGGVAVSSRAAGHLLTPNEAVRGFGFKVQAAAATLVVGAKIRTYLQVVSAPVGM
ncbi:MAG: hypothetical protein EOP38_26675 [Rubrivivax sp.]|nr:MAG: hypothetical protein EOP38_26675 [Rubrivivax sp.]